MSCRAKQANPRIPSAVACLKCLVGRTTWGGSMSKSLLRRLRFIHGFYTSVGSSTVKVGHGLRG